MGINKIISILSSFDGISNRQAEKLALQFIKNSHSTIRDLNEIERELTQIEVCPKCGCFSFGKCSNHVKSDIIHVFNSLEEYISFESKNQSLKAVFITNLVKRKDFVDLYIMENMIKRLLNYYKETKANEIFFIVSPSIELDILISFVKQNFFDKKIEVSFSKLQIGIPFGSNISYSDEKTLREVMNKREKI